MSAGVGLVKAGAAISKKQDLKTVGELLTAVAGVAAFAPPPYGTVMSGALQVVGAVLPMFAGPAKPSKEVEMLKGIKIQLDTVLENQNEMMKSLIDISDHQKIVDDFQRNKIERVT